MDVLFEFVFLLKWSIKRKSFYIRIYNTGILAIFDRKTESKNEPFHHLFDFSYNRILFMFAGLRLVCYRKMEKKKNR